MNTDSVWQRLSGRGQDKARGPRPPPRTGRSGKPSRSTVDWVHPGCATSFSYGIAAAAAWQGRQFRQWKVRVVQNFVKRRLPRPNIENSTFNLKNAPQFPKLCKMLGMAQFHWRLLTLAPSRSFACGGQRSRWQAVGSGPICVP